MNMHKCTSAPDILIPIAIDLDWPTKDSIVQCVREQHTRYGFRRFALAAPSGGWRSVGYPSREVYENLAKLFVAVRDELLADGIECGWWITATLKSGRSEQFSGMVDTEGKPSFFANCPLDPVFRKTFSENVARFAEIARPAFIITEDDYSIHAGSSEYGCFCEHHLAEFAKRMGKAYTREELISIFRAGTEESNALLRAWRELIRDSMVLISREIREAVDRKTPEIPIGYMQSGGADMDGDCTAAVCRALAGERHAPFCRFYGTSYCGGDSKDIPRVLHHALYSKQHAEDIVAYHESDTFPHTRFFMSADFMRAMMSVVYSAGFDGSTFQTQQLLDDPNEEPAYGRMFRSERRRFAAIHKIAKQCVMRGVEIGYDPFWNTVDQSVGAPRPLWARPVGLFGIPYVTTPQRVAFWDVRQARHCDHETVLAYLSRGLILDGAAAAALVERGYGKYLGISVANEDVASGALQYDLAAREVLKDHVLPTLTGRHMPSPHMFCKGNNGQLWRITVTDPACEVLTELVSFAGEVVAPVMTRFENELGGRVAVMGVTLYHEKHKKDNLSQSLYNYRRQRLLQELVDWCGGDYVAVVGDANVMTVMNEPADAQHADFRAMITLVNLGNDRLDRVHVKLPSHLETVNEVSYLNRSGAWIRQSFSQKGDTITVERPLGFGEPVCLLLR